MAPLGSLNCSHQGLALPRHSRNIGAEPGLPSGDHLALEFSSSLARTFLELCYSLTFFLSNPLSGPLPFGKCQPALLPEASLLLPFLPHSLSFTGILPNTFIAYLILFWHLFLRGPQMTCFLYLPCLTAWTTPQVCMIPKILEC